MINFILSQWHALYTHTGEHLMLSMSAMSIAIIIGMPLGIYIFYHKKMRAIILSISNICQTIPSLALLALFIPLLGIGTAPTIVTLTLYALLPIIRNTYTGLNEIKPSYRETAYSIGLNRRQQLLWVELPLALPTIIAGIRTASAMTIGITTIAAFVGAGGLGVFITQGLAINDSRFILLGAIPTALLALSIDFLISKIEKYIRSPSSHRHKKYVRAVIGVAAFLVCFGTLHTLTSHADKKNRIVVASKNFTEQIILGNIIAELLTHKNPPQSHTPI